MTPGQDWHLRPTLRPREVAELSGLSIKTVRRLIEDGRLRSRRIGRAVLVLTPDVISLLEGDAQVPRRTAFAPRDERVRLLLGRLSRRSRIL